MMKMVMGKIDFMKQEGDDNRALGICITLKHDGISSAELEKEYDKMVDYMESNLSNCEFVKCPEADEEAHTYCDSFYIDFEYGTMSKVKKEINREWKACKKELGFC